MLKNQRDFSQPVMLKTTAHPFVLLLIMSLMVVMGQCRIWASSPVEKDIINPAAAFSQQKKTENRSQPIIFEAAQHYQVEPIIKSITAQSGIGPVFTDDKQTTSKGKTLQSLTSPLAAKKTAPTLPGQKKESRLQPIILRAAQRYQVDPAIIKAIIMAESGFNPKAVSNKGARGLMQLMPRTAKYLGVKDSFNPEHNIDGGVRYFKTLLDRFDCDVKLALAAYNAGSRNVRKYDGVPPFKSTKFYIKKVLTYYETYKNDSKGILLS